MDDARVKQMLALRDLLRELPIEFPVATRHCEPAESPRERAISFNDAMIRALRAGRKSETRRPMKQNFAHSRTIGGITQLLDADGSEIKAPFGAPGDRLWVRERWARRARGYVYSADGETAPRHRVTFRPTFQMPRDACRLRLTITSVAPQRLQSITTVDAQREGYDPALDTSPRRWFANLWDSIYSAAPLRWGDNPWVWVVKFQHTLSF